MEKTNETRVCTKCGQNKAIEDFSLMRGKHSEDRKTYCVQCEGLMRKARTKYGLELYQFNALMRMPCFVCGCKAKHIDKAERLNGVLCSRCWSFLKSIMPTDDNNIIGGCYNYLVFREKFPFWLKYQLSLEVKDEPTPLLDLIDENDS